MAARTLFSHRFQDGLFDVQGKEWIELRGRRRVDFRMLVPYGLHQHIFYVKWFAPSHEFIGNAAECILITLRADEPLKLLRGHVCRGPILSKLPCSCLPQHRCNAKIGE